MTMATINIEDITCNKQEILSEFCRTYKFDILCIQETNCSSSACRPSFNEMHLIIEHQSATHRSAILVRNDIAVEADETSTNAIEALTIEVGPFTVNSIYKPPGES